MGNDADDDPPPRRKRGVIRVESGQPVTFREDDSNPITVETIDAEETALLRTFRAYGKAARELLDGRYAQVRAAAPAHLREPTDTMIVKCSDGILVRGRPSQSDPSDAAIRDGSSGSFGHLL